MEVTGTLFYLLVNAFRVYILYRFLGLFLKQKISKRRLFCCYAFFFLINSAGYLFLSSDMVNLLTNFIGLLLVVRAGYEGSILKKVISVFASYGVAVLTEDLAWVLLVKTAKEESAGQITEFGFFFAVFLFFLLEAVIERTIKLKKEIGISLYKNIMLIIISVGSIFLSGILIEGFYHNPFMLIIALCILIAIDIAIFYVYEKLLDDHVKLKNEEMHHLQLVMYQNQLNLMQNVNDSYRSMRHNMKQHLSMLTGYLQNNEKDKALDYLSQINGSISGDKYIDTGNKDVDCIFNYIIGEVIENGGSVTTDIKVPEEMPVDNFDLNVILSNLLLNACEAVRKCDKKEIYVAMRYDRGVLKISIQNTYNGVLKQKGDELLSTKQEKEGHGIGIQSVRETVEKYGGIMKINHTEDKFKVDILLYI